MMNEYFRGDQDRLILAISAMVRDARDRPADWYEILDQVRADLAAYDYEKEPDPK